MELAIAIQNKPRHVAGPTDALDFFPLAGQADRPQQLHQVLRDTLQGLGIHFFQLIRMEADKKPQVLWTEATTAPASVSLDLSLTGDSALEPSSRHHAGKLKLWSALQLIKLEEKRLQHVDSWLAQSLAAGVRSGASITLHQHAHSKDLFRVAGISRSLFDEDEADIGLCCTIAAFAARRLRVLEKGQRNSGADHPSLSLRELEVLRWCRDGKSYPEIAIILGVSAKTIEFHMTNAMRKFGVNQKISVILAAARSGLIEL